MQYTPLTAKDYMKIDYIYMLNDEMINLREIAVQIFDNFMPFRMVPAISGEASVVTVDHINQIELAIGDLAAILRPAGLKPTRLWLGENSDNPLLDYTDVNRWFESFAVLRQALMGRGHDFKRCGSYTAGQNRVRQIVRAR